MEETVEGYICDVCLQERADRLYVVGERDYSAEKEEMRQWLASTPEEQSRVLSEQGCVPRIHYRDAQDRLKTFWECLDKPRDPSTLIPADIDDPAFACAKNLQATVHTLIDTTVHMGEILRLIGCEAALKYLQPPEESDEDPAQRIKPEVCKDGEIICSRHCPAFTDQHYYDGSGSCGQHRSLHVEEGAPCLPALRRRLVELEQRCALYEREWERGGHACIEVGFPVEEDPVEPTNS
jgi:hypothetical protein